MTTLRNRPASQLLIAATVLVVVGCCLLRSATERIDVAAQAGFPVRFIRLSEVVERPAEIRPALAARQRTSVSAEVAALPVAGSTAPPKLQLPSHAGPAFVSHPSFADASGSLTTTPVVEASGSWAKASVGNLRPATVRIDSEDGPPLVSSDAGNNETLFPRSLELMPPPPTGNVHAASNGGTSDVTSPRTGSRFQLPRVVAGTASPSPAISAAKKASTSTSLNLAPLSPVPPNTRPPAPQTPDLNRASFFKLAEQPQVGEHFHQSPPCIDPRAGAIPADIADFQPAPCFDFTHDPAAALDIYAGKPCQPTQRPWLELGRCWYDKGPLPASQSWFGFHNPDQFQFILAGDQRIAYASNTQRNDSTSLIAAQLNLDFDLRLTSTERFHWFIQPLTQGTQNSRWLLDEDEFDSELNADFLFGYFEGDLGAMVGGWRGQTLPFDLPFSLGVMPLVLQNGVWMEDAILGVAATLPAQNLPRLGVSNFDITFLAGYDQLDSPAFEGDDNAAKIYAILAFIEAWGGYVEADYAFLEDRSAARDRSYHNAAIGYTRRFGLLSNSTRVIANAGQSTAGGPNTADGVLLLSENSLITSSPYSCVPYLNLFAGFDRPQSAARQAAAGGVLRNTGILFETDNLTGYPTLDPTANETFGFAAGLNLLAPDFSQQLILEAAWLGTMGDDATRVTRGNQGGVGARYQLPLSHRVILRMDVMAGFLESDADVHGARIEMRRKF